MDSSPGTPFFPKHISPVSGKKKFYYFSSTVLKMSKKKKKKKWWYPSLANRNHAFFHTFFQRIWHELQPKYIYILQSVCALL